MDTKELRQHIGNILNLYYTKQITGTDAKTQLQSIDFNIVAESLSISKSSLQNIVADRINFINDRENL